MKYSEWLEIIEPKRTKKGARLDLRLYVYPKEHGNIYVRHGGLPGQPVNDVEEAIRVIRDLWRKASRVHDGADAVSKEAQLDQLLERVTPENIHGEIDTGHPVGREVW